MNATRRATPAAAILLAALAAAATARAEVRWRSLAPRGDRTEVCLRIGEVRATYFALNPDEPTLLRVRGPRRVKILTRYLFAPDEESPAAHAVRVEIDGRQELSEALRARPHEGTAACEDGRAASRLRRFYVTVPAGWHDVTVAAETSGPGVVAARFFREVSRVSREHVSLAPERYAAVATLQFDSGARSSYYLFDAERPLVVEVGGPTTAVIWTRLDFDHTMTGMQPYGLEIRVDGEVRRTCQYHTGKLDAAAWVERPDVLPGARKTLRLPVAKGRHRIEIRCLRPSGCGVAAMVRIPAGDVR